MPAAVPVVAALAGAAASASGIGFGALGLSILNSGLGFSFLGAQAFANSIAGFVVSSALNAVGSRAFSPSSSGSQPDFTQAAQSQAVMVRSSVETHKVVYGQARIAGPVVFVCTTDSGPDADGNTISGTNAFLHMLVALTGHEVEEIGDIYFNDQPVTINEDGWVTSYPYTQASTGVSTNTQHAISTAVRTDGVVTVTTSSPHGFFEGDKVILASVTPDGAMNGAYIIQSVPSSTTFTYNNGGPNSSASGGTATNATNNSTTTSFARVIKHTGSEGQEADATMVEEVPGWTTAHRLQGISYVYVRLQYDQAVFSAGIPNISAVVKGKKVYDPRDDTTAWTDNVALCIRDYLTSDYGFNCSDDEINDTYVSAAANHCDESVTLTTGGSQNRYTCNGVIDTASTPIDNLNALVSAMAGTVTYVQGQFRPYAGVYDTTVGDLTASMLAGQPKGRFRTPRQQLFNAVKGTYVDPNLNWQPTDFPAITNETYLDADGGQAIYKDVQLPFTNHPEAAQRLATILLNQARQGILVELPLNHTAMPLAVWDTVTYTHAYLGWNQKVFRVKKLTTTGTGAVVVSLQEEASASYDWNSGMAQTLDPAPDTNLPNPLIVAIPTGVGFSSRAVETPGGDTVFILSLQWDEVMDTFVVQGGRIELQYKLHTDSAWNPSFFAQGDLTSADVLTSSINTAYDLRVRNVNSLGTPSRWVPIPNAIAGSSGGVGTTQDFGEWVSSPGATQDFGEWVSSPGGTQDWGFFT